MIQVVGLGQCSLDYLGLIDAFPAEDDKCEFHGLRLQGGGPVATALVCLGRLGRRTEFIGRVGDDAFGDVIRRELAAEGVGVAWLETVPGASSQFAFIPANPHTGSRTVFWTRSSAPDLEPDRLPEETIGRAQVLHLDGLTADSSIAAAEVARAAGTATVLDAGTLRPHTLDLARRIDHLVVGQPLARTWQPDLPPEETVKRLYDLGGQATVITLGSAGSIGYDGREVIRQPAFEVAVIDTTGAGDAYHGGYIDGLLDGLDLAGRMERAAAVAALNCTALGGRTALPDRAELEKFLKAAKVKRLGKH